MKTQAATIIGVGTALCGAACATPLWIALGVGVASAWASSLEWLGLAVIVLGVVWMWRSPRHPAASGRAANGVTQPASRCGCGPSTGYSFRATTDVVACSLDATEIAERLVEFGELWRDDYVDRERISGGVRFRFKDREGLMARLHELAAREHACCPFVDFDIYVCDDELWWDTRAGVDAAAVLDVWYALPEHAR